jgi:predicted N-acetyltransferase YhbS
VEIIEASGDDLVLRRATAADAEALAAFNGEVHRESGQETNATIAAWTRDLLRGGHPTSAADDFTVVVERASGRIVSTVGLIDQTWSYGGVPFGVGRVELVGTSPDYRKRGLVRRQVEIAHRRSAERGHLVQAITGIPHYYRRFGYEMALELGAGRTGYRLHVPGLPADAAEPFRVRPASAADLPFVAGLDEGARGRWLVAAVRDEALWRYEMDGRCEELRTALLVVEDAAGRPVGYLAHPRELWGPALTVLAYELAPGTSWLAVAPSVLRYLRATGESYQAHAGTPWEAFTFSLGAEHPAYRAVPDRLPRTVRSYAYYLRVPDLPAFLRRVAPVLEGRLATSAAAGHTGELRIGFYGDGLRLVFAQGRMEAAEPWAPGEDGTSAPAFPGLTFLQLLFGYRSLAELEHAFADCVATGEAGRVLLDALFPKQASHVWPVD